ncbi:MAG: endopeptidase La [Negativicoccus succinicivorans]|uniref:endopeptidase La n=1 Tax=Negativicoccus succinicivorans TaxID=620903 RepID=UPI0026EBC91D|nr:endopeptidase La [Negativicoccus succinicivorans]MBS6027919.1 endopeptidase La [Negativicoccus succinicivorans]
MAQKEIEGSMKFPLLPLRDVTLFPQMVTGIEVGRPQSVAAVREAMQGDGYVACVMQRHADTDNPDIDDLYTIGTIGKIKQILQLPDGVLRVLLEGVTRVHLLDIEATGAWQTAEVIDCVLEETDSPLLETYRRDVVKRFGEWLEHAQITMESDALAQFEALTDPGEVADFVTMYLPLAPAVRQRILAELSVELRLAAVRKFLLAEQEIAALEKKLNAEVRQGMDKNQREYYLREKLRVIRDELGDHMEIDEEVDEYRKKLAALELPAASAEKIEKEIKRLEKTPPLTPDAAVLRNYLDWIFDLPWNTESTLATDLKEAQTVLDADHFGLTKIKERILEHLAVRQLTQSQKGPILCFVGPPGTGKTSLAQSIARALGAEFTRVSLGGVHDESEIRGHRRTYIGALPGRLIQGIARAKTKNPVFLLDEIDKLGNDFRGDPASALLEALDPQQNGTFSDHFIELPFDFSNVFFITTANTTNSIPEPLLDRMEVITLSGYTEEEKVEIAKRYLLPRQIKENGLAKSDVRLSQAVLRRLIRDYTREAGVRRLEQVIGSVCRKLAKRKVMREETLTVTVKNLETLLGPARYLTPPQDRRDEVGRVTGLAWTQVGGEVLNTEVTAFSGSGKMILTGQLGDVMKESAQAAYTYVRSRAEKLHLAADFYRTIDIHIHLPEGAIPKDGPSAGITMATAIASAVTKCPVRADTAMTGEITLRGQVLAVGGIKEKVLAAHRAGIRRILLPKENRRNLADIPQSVRDDLVFHFVSHMDEVLQQAMSEPVKQKRGEA